jgi:hypothetical protein
MLSVFYAEVFFFCRGTACPYLFGSDRLLAGLVQLLDGLLVVTQILLAPNENDWEAGAEVEDFRNPLLSEHVSALFLMCTSDKWKLV